MSALALRGGKPIHSGAWPRWPVSDEREIERIVQVVRSGVWSMSGPQELEFRTGFAKFLGVPYGVCVTNGTHSLQLALEALDIGAGDEVIVPALTFVASSNIVLQNRLRPVFVDIDPVHYEMDPALIADRNHESDQGAHARSPFRSAV